MYGLIDITEKKKEGTNASTSKQCLWNQPRSRKLSPKKASELIFKKQKFNDKNNNTIFPNVRTSSCADSPSISVEPVDILRFGNKLKQCNPHAGFLLTHEHTIDKFKQPSNRAKENLGLPEPPFMFRDCVDMSSENCLKCLMIILKN
ncbi:hypothetical protein DPMN_033503 [Dreissena polymorpha]|uniref:Uncharacterized protein n=1 Tax=Dreissena polymorpha TaxID=45954 RepID=A0A9D4M659_DREPO|nr:hypothetical protein DPMN_033503 [Dreissena polymorpha]